MFDFRKVVLGMAGAVLAAGSAFGQCAGTSTSPIPVLCVGATANFVAAEGLTEQLPPLVISNTTGAATSVTGGVSFIITSTVPFTNETPSTATVPGQIDATVTDNSGDTTGVVTQTGPTTVQVSFTSVTAPLTTITVSGLRVEASASTAPSISVSLSVTPTSGVTVGSPSSFAASYLKASLAATTDVASPGVQLASTTPTSAYTVETVTINGGFGGVLPFVALKSMSDVQNGSTITSQGTRLAVTFSNLNANVNYYVPATIGTAPLSLTAYTSATGSTAATTVTTPTAVSGLVELPAPVSGSSTIYYGVTADDAGGAGTASFALSEVVPTASLVTSVSTLPPAVSIVLAGFTGTGYPQYSTTQTPNTASAATTPPTTAGTLIQSTTTLVFPYVTNAGGFDTGIAITNATAGLSDSGQYSAKATGTPGGYTIYFYGTNAPTAPVTSSAATPAGTVGTPFLLSTVAAGFDGYLIVTADFSDAHGFALITNGTITEGYLAIVTNNGTATSPTF